MRMNKTDALSLRTINQIAMSERVRKEHPGNMHLWWNRSPIESSKKLLKTVVVYDQGIDTCAKVVDPFSGFGGLALAAEEVGLSAVAGDLNSVASVLTKAAAEIPARFVDRSAVSPDADNRIYTGIEGLAEDIQCYGNVIRSEAEKLLFDVYPDSISSDGQKERVYAWIWARTVICPNPACGCKMPLANSYVLSKMKNREYYGQPEVNGNEVSFQVLKGSSASAQLGNKIGSSGAKFQCPACGEITTDEYVKGMGRKNQLGIQLMAVCYEGPNGREYLSSTEEQLQVAMVDLPSEIPLGELPNNTRWFSPPLFGLKNYADLYSPRQKRLMTTLCDMVIGIRKKIFTDAIKAGFPDDGIPLSKGGSGALAYSEAVSVYLTFVVDKMASFQSEICTWDNRSGNIRAAFTRQAIPMTWVFAEGNPFSSVTGNYNTMLQDVVRSVRNLPYNSSATVYQGDGTRFEFPENSILFTELPYYDNVGYADLSDYFYVWMRRCLKDVYPKLFERVVTSKDELTSIPEHYGGDAAAAKQAYEEGIRRLFNNFIKAASKDYPSVVFFEFGKKDLAAMSFDTGDRSAWDNIIEAIIGAGFSILATLPVRTQKPNDRYESTRVAIIFAVQAEDAVQTTRRGFVSALKKELPELLQSLYKMDMDDWDRPITGIGCGLSFFSRYKKIINADGSAMSVHDASQVIYAEVNEFISENFSGTDSAEFKEVNHAGEL